MGQTNLPLLNRVGYFLFWDSVWEDFFNYARSLREDFFIKNLINIILIDRIIFSKFFFSFKFYKFLNNYSSSFFLNFESFYMLRNSFKKLAVRSIPVYFSKIWFIKFQNWCFVSMYIYKPIVSIPTNNFLNLDLSYNFFKNALFYKLFNRKLNIAYSTIISNFF